MPQSASNCTLNLLPRVFIWILHVEATAVPFLPPRYEYSFTPCAPLPQLMAECLSTACNRNALPRFSLPWGMRLSRMVTGPAETSTAIFRAPAFLPQLQGSRFKPAISTGGRADAELVLQKEQIRVWQHQAVEVCPSPGSTPRCLLLPPPHY